MSKQPKFLGPINLKKWAKENPAKTFTYKGKTHTVGSKFKAIISLNDSQTEHVHGLLNVYEPIKAYSQQYKHYTDPKEPGKFLKATPIGEPRRNDLPPIYLQWKEDFRRRKLADRHRISVEAD